MRLRFSDLAEMSPAKKALALDRFVQASRLPVGPEIDAELRELETRYRLTSSEMMARFERGEIEENSDVSTWLMLVGVKAGVR